MTAFRLYLRPDLAAAVRPLTAPATKETAERIAAQAKAIAPVGTAEDNDRHPGAYRASIGVTVQPDGGATVYADAPHAPYVEFGVPGRGIAAHHTMSNAAGDLGFDPSGRGR